MHRHLAVWHAEALQEAPPSPETPEIRRSLPVAEAFQPPHKYDSPHFHSIGIKNQTTYSYTKY